MIPLPIAWAADPGAGLAAARDAEQDRRWGEIADRCRPVIAEAPTSPEAARCAAMVARWDLRRDGDGGFDDLALLEAVRRGEREPDALSGWTTDAAVAPVLRGEAVALRARRALDGGDPAGAEAILASRPERGPDPQVDAVLDGLAEEIRASRGGGGRPGTRAAQRARRRWVSIADGAAAAVGGLSLAACLPAAFRGSDRRAVPWGAGLLLATGAAAGGVAEAFEPGSARPLVPLVAGLLGVHLVAVGALRDPGGPTWPLRAAIAAASLGVGWLALSRGGALQALGLE